MCKKLIYILFFMLMLVLAEGEAQVVYLAAYWDGNYGTAWVGGGEGTRDVLETEGYEVLDAVTLKVWMNARIADGAASVVVFCRDVVPDTVAESMSTTCTLRQYLDAGGKIVWYGDIPFWYLASAGAGNTIWGDAGAPAILGFDTSGAPRSSWNDVTLTNEGIKWGLAETWQSERPASTSVVASENLTVLATDNAGNAAAWVKHYVPGDDSRGFVRFRDTGGQANVDDIMRIAEYGIVVNPYDRRPNPADGVIHTDMWVRLCWSSGRAAVSYDVYFGENFDDVETGTKGTFQGNQTATYFSVGSARYPCLVPGVTYYWRVDEVEADGVTIYKGSVWSFRTIPETDPNLIGWWKFDEGSGNIAHDSSGNGNNGTFNGNPQWVPGHFNYALEFDGSDDWLDCGKDTSLQITDAVTVSAWIKVGTQNVDHKIGGNQDDVNGGYKMTIHNNRVEFEIRTSENTPILNRNVSGGTILEQDVWYHLAGVYSRKGNYIRTYVDGSFDRELVTDEVLGASPGPFIIGCEPFMAGLYNFNGVIDDLRIYNHALTEGEILGVMEDGEKWPFAFHPEPADGAISPNMWVSLSWSPGGIAVSHNVYLGDNFDDVKYGTGDTFQGNQTTTYFTVGSARYPCLVPGVIYYWRIDEIEGDGVTIHKGDIWSFAIQPWTAYEPEPADGAKYVDLNVVLSWSPGRSAQLHTVYFGDNFDDVNKAAGGVSQEATTYIPGTLEFDKVYYWRIDEVEADGTTVHRGNVWSFSTKSDPINIGLVAYYPLSAGRGNIITDASGNKHDGIAQAPPEWVDGPIGYGRALYFDGSNPARAWVNCGTWNPSAGTGQLTVAFWVRWDGPAAGMWQIAIAKRNNWNEQGTEDMWLIGTDKDTHDIYFYRQGDWPSCGNTVLPIGQWLHVAVTFNGATMIFYIDGQETGRDEFSFGPKADSTLCIGAAELGGWGGFHGALDEIRLYNIALGPTEIKSLATHYGAFNPDPADGATHLDSWITLSWLPGVSAISHDVYFGDNRYNVDTGTGETFMGSQTETWFNVGSVRSPYLVPETTYYWRIDEVYADGTTYKGDVWSFSRNP